MQYEPFQKSGGKGKDITQLWLQFVQFASFFFQRQKYVTIASG
jgi:hypothetical protein